MDPFRQAGRALGMFLRNLGRDRGQRLRRANRELAGVA